MKILSHIHAYPPEHNAGAEWMQHAIMKELVKRGHECKVLTTTSNNYELDGVQVYQDDFDNCKELWRWCDVGFTHLMRTGKAWNWSIEVHKPLVYIVHNTFTNRIIEVKQNISLIYNTNHAKADGIGKGYNHNNMVLHPPVWFEDYHTETTGEYITLINCWGRKGGQVLIDLAKNNPDLKFLGVLGGYGDQLQANLPNLTYIKNTPNIKEEVYAKTKILIMPSVYESYGRTAVEAMCSGIPVVASETVGLVEALGDLGFYVPEVNDESELNYKGFEKLIYKLLNKTDLSKLSLQLINRAKEYDERNYKEIDELEQFIKEIICKHEQ